MIPSTDIFIFNQASLPILIVTTADSAADKGKKDFEETAVGLLLLCCIYLQDHHVGAYNGDLCTAPHLLIM